MAEIEELKKKLAQNPDSLIFVPLADAYRRAGLHNEAIEVCKKGLEKHTSYTSARVVLGRIYSEKEMLDDAIAEFKKVEAVDVDNLMVHSMLGNIYIKKKRYAEAVEQFQRVLSLNPDDSETQEKLQEALAAKQSPAPPEKKEPPKPEPKAPEAPKPAEQKAEVKPEQKQEPKPAPKPEAKPEDKSREKEYVQKSLTAAELYTRKEEFSKAIEIYNELLNKDQENLIIQQRLREVYNLQDKKIQKEKERASAGKTAAAAQSAKDRIDSDKITAQDILDVMKEAVDEDKVDDEPVLTKEQPAVKKEAPKAEAKTEAKPAAAEPAKSIDSGKAGKIEKVLRELESVEGIVGSFMLQRDGKIVASVLPDKFKKAEIEPVVASIVSKTEQSVQSMKQGKLNRVAITAESGVLTFTEIGGGVLFIIGNEKINVGKMGYVLKDVIEHMKAALA
jgi:tetratricopeptide (TPR) repeat protein/predicted regulator of Ras-like GTPase activity (Roadblock/LC7/MglB family)